jgi:PAS domain-containing protein
LAPHNDAFESSGLALAGLRNDGQEIPVEISLAQMRVGEDAYSIAVVRDVTERKAFERLLAKADDDIRRRDEALAIRAAAARLPPCR